MLLIQSDPKAHRRRLAYRITVELRLCADILNEMISMPTAEIYKAAPKMPSMSLRLPDWRIPKTPPIDLTTVLEKLERGAYKDAEDFKIDVILVFAFCRAAANFEASPMPLHDAEARFKEFCQTDNRKDYFLSTMIYAARMIRWKWWMPRTLPPELSPNAPNSILLTFIVKDDMTASRRFSATTTFEQIYAFVECYDAVVNFPKSAEVQQPLGYNHEYDFRLHLRSAGTPCDVRQGRIGDFLGSNTDAELTVEILDESEPPQDSIAGHAFVDAPPTVLGKHPTKEGYETGKEYTKAERFEDHISPHTNVGGPDDGPANLDQEPSPPAAPITQPQTGGTIPDIVITRENTRKAPNTQAATREGPLEADCRHKLTTYAAFRIRKLLEPDQKPSWAKAKVTEDRLDPSYIKEQIAMLSAGKQTMPEKWAALDNLLQLQITTLLKDLNSEETDKRFEWSLVQMQMAETISETGTRSPVLGLYIKSAPAPYLDVVAILRDLENKRSGVLVSPDPQEEISVEGKRAQSRILDEKSVGGTRLFLVLKNAESRHTARWQSANDIYLAPEILQHWEEDKQDILQSRSKNSPRLWLHPRI
jgi:hypothetical protein